MRGEGGHAVTRVNIIYFGSVSMLICLGLFSWVSINLFRD